jgi:CheY-like chemotaxis protein
VAMVLVVDDEPDYRFLLRMLLRDHDVDVVEAPNGKQALELIDDRVPDVIVTDLRMPVMDGHALVEQLESDGLLHEIRVLVWSADPDRTLPVDAIVPKPYGGDALVRQVTELLER